VSEQEQKSDFGVSGQVATVWFEIDFKEEEVEVTLRKDFKS
jgi:hypothetical protein